MQYPSMGEISSTMWCEYDDDDDTEDSEDDTRGGGGGGGGGKHGGGVRPRLLRVSVQTLDGHVCDDEDEDSETDDGESDTDYNDDDDDSDFERFAPTAAPPMRERRQGRRHPSQRIGGRAGGRVSRAARGELPASGGGRVFGGRKNKEGAEEGFDEVECQRREELASVLRRLRAAIRRMDCVLTEEKVGFKSLILTTAPHFPQITSSSPNDPHTGVSEHGSSDEAISAFLVFLLSPHAKPHKTQVRSLARRIARVAAATASTSELVTTAAARGAIRGLGDRIRLDRQRNRSGGGGSRDVRWVTVYVGVGRCDEKRFD